MSKLGVGQLGKEMYEKLANKAGKKALAKIGIGGNVAKAMLQEGGQEGLQELPHS